VSNALARVFALWRTGLPRPVLVLQGGDALNYFGTGLLLPFEIIYLHAARGFSTATAGLVLATVMGTAAVVTLPSGALLDRFSAKRILIAGNVLNGLGYGSLAFVDRPWQGFVCSASARRLRASSSRPPIITSRRSRASTSSTQSRSWSSR
jgi:MFS family permease